MTSSRATLALDAAQQQLCALVEGLDDEGYRAQFHPELSPVGWHLGHCAYIENYWLREVVCGDGRLTRPAARYYVPAGSPRAERGPVLPSKEELTEAVRHQQSENLRLLARISPQGHALLKDDYLTHFLVQHHGQHMETMHLALNQRALANGYGGFAPASTLRSAATSRACGMVKGGRYRIGGKRPEAFDNELPAHDFECEGFSIATLPISNAEYLSFIEDDAYSTRRHWSEDGWRWLKQTDIEHPEHWRQDTRGCWFGIHAHGFYELAPEDPVYGISYHEAWAFAAWAGARLPHEYEWEIAYRAGLLEATGRVWEWCDNSFHPYAGFKPFPYNEYSLPWFDGTHRTLRGGSIYTHPDLRRASFRNFYTADKRHIFGGLRLAFTRTRKNQSCVDRPEGRCKVA